MNNRLFLSLRSGQFLFGVVLLNIFFCGGVSAESLPKYQADELKPQTISSVGSDSMDGLMKEWARAYRVHQPDVRVNLVSRGSALAPAALVDGSASLGPMSRPMKEKEVENFLSKHGFQPTQIKTALSVAAVYVGADSPIDSLSLSELDAIFSKDRNRGAGKSITSWKNSSLNNKIVKLKPHTLATSSQNIAFFKQKALLQGSFASQVNSSLESMESLFKLVLADSAVIAVGNYENPPAGVKVVAIRNEDNSPAILPTTDTSSKSDYPLSKFLNLYVVKEPGSKFDEASEDFLNFVLSEEGQKVVKSLGLIPLSSDTVRAELSQIN